MVAGVQAVVQSREIIKMMGEAARAFAETQTWPAMMEQVVEHYERIITEHHAAQAIA